MTTTMITLQEKTKRKGSSPLSSPERRPSHDDNVRIFYKYRNSTVRWIEIRRSHLDEATRHHHTLLYQHLHHVRQPGTRGGSHRGYFRRQYSYGTKTANTLVRQVSFLGRKLQRRGSGGDRQLDHQARRQRLLRYVIWNVCMKCNRMMRAI